MWIYLVIAIITAIFSEVSVKSKSKAVRKLGALITVTLPSFFYSIRYGIGTDYFNYVSAFNRIQIIGFEDRFEWAYVSLNLLVGRLGGSVEILFFITALIMMIFLYLGLREYSNSISIGFAMFAYMLLFYQMSFNMVRHSVAMTICLFAYKYIRDRKLVKFLLCVFLATGFHNSSLILVPIYFLYKPLADKNKKFSRLWIYIITTICVLSIDKLITPILQRSNQLSYYLIYLQSEGSQFTFNYLIRHAPFILVGVFLYKYIKRYDDRFVFLFSLYVTSLLLKLSGMIGIQYINRISVYLEIALILMIAYCVRYLNNLRYFFVSMGIVSYLVIYWYYTYIYTGAHGTFPYMSILGL